MVFPVIPMAKGRLSQKKNGLFRQGGLSRKVSLYFENHAYIPLSGLYHDEFTLLHAESFVEPELLVLQSIFDMTLLQNMDSKLDILGLICI